MRSIMLMVKLRQYRICMKYERKFGKRTWQKIMANAFIGCKWENAYHETIGRIFSRMRGGV